ncbi:hypothetical protein [Pseudomonas alabamensis]|uniref:hypothetical protein n=1 Tax=Pseudomonas alabamensis TaxID=3064349 RepID=UPI00119FC8A6
MADDVILQLLERPINHCNIALATSNDMMEGMPHRIAYVIESLKMEVERLKREGLLMIAVSVVLIVVALILSIGYDPRGGLLWSLANKMYLFRVALGCDPQPTWIQIVQSCRDGFFITVQTKYVISALALLLVYGIGQCLEFFPSLRFWRRNSRAE